VENRLKIQKIPYIREARIGDLQDIPDFIVWDLIVLEFKAKPFLQREDFEQVQRYLQQTNLKLGILVNFRAKYLKPQRILNNNSKKNIPTCHTILFRSADSLDFADNCR
jgi:GxxExxY protein